MKKIEITNEITKYLTQYPIQLTDLLGYSIQLNSYEKYIEEFLLVKNTFNTDIPKYSAYAIEKLNKMADFIDECMTNEADLPKYISSNISKRICNSIYDRRITANYVSPNNLKGGPEKSVQAIKQVYSELGDEQLDNYIELIKTPSNLSSYLINEKKQVSAMHYFLFATNHHSNSRLKRDKSAQTIYELTQSTIKDTLKEITAEKDDYIKFMNEQKEEYLSWFEQTTNDYAEFLNTCKNSFEDTDKTFSEKLKVEKPAEFMMKKAKEYKTKSIIWTVATSFMAIILIILLSFILDPNIEVKDKLITVQLFTGNITIYNTIIIFAIITLIVFTLKLFVKMTVSVKHLSEEYHQKYVLTYFYLSLIKDGKMTIDQGNSILATLFTKADTGLLKNDSSSEIEAVQKILTSLKS